MHRLIGISAAMLMAGGSSLATAQTIFLIPSPGEQGTQSPNVGSQPSASQPSFSQQSGSQQSATPSSGSRSDQRANLRQRMMQEGFQDIRISEATFFVQARTPDGRDVLMVVRPDGQDQQVSSAQQMQQRGGGFGYYHPDPMAAPDFDQMRGEGQRAGGGMMADRGQPSQDQALSVSPGSRSEATGSISGVQIIEADQVRSQLQSRGFSNIRDWEFDNGMYTATADWYGQEVDVRVNALSGDVVQPTGLEPSQVRNLLRERGFTNIENVQRRGDVFQARAERNGSTFTIEIDPRQARIENRMPQQSGEQDQSQGG